MGVVSGILCMVLVVVGIVAYSSDASQLVDSVSTVNLETLLSSNLTNLSSVVIDERGESEASDSAVELYLEHQKNLVNASGWNEYTISITNPNEEDIQKTIYLEGTRYNRDATECWVRDSEFDSKIVATLENMTVHPGIPFRLRCLCSLRQRARGIFISLR